MSGRNGDTARHNRDKKKRQLRRKINRELRKELLGQTGEAKSNTTSNQTQQ